MSNGKGPTPEQRAALFSQIVKIGELVIDGHRSAADVSRVLNAIIGNEVIECRPRIVKQNGDRFFLLYGSFLSWDRLLEACDFWNVRNESSVQAYFQDVEAQHGKVPFQNRPVDEYVRLRRLRRNQKTVAELMAQYHLVDPVAVLVFVATLRRIAFDSCLHAPVGTYFAYPNQADVWYVGFDRERDLDGAARLNNELELHFYKVDPQSVALNDDLMVKVSEEEIRA